MKNSVMIRRVRSLATVRTFGGGTEADPAAVHRETVQLVAFSDAVFAITVTLLVLDIRPPSDDRNLLHELAALWPSYLADAVTFLFIGQVWANHHVMFDHIRAADRVILLLNTVLLMVVAFLPFLLPSSPWPFATRRVNGPPSSSTASHSSRRR